MNFKSTSIPVGLRVMAERQVSDFEIANGGFRKQAVPLIDSENEHKRIELVRAAVDLTKEATRAISIKNCGWENSRRRVWSRKSFALSSRIRQ